MKTIRTLLASVTAAPVLTVGGGSASAQAEPMPYTLQADPQIPSITSPEQRNEVMRLFTAHVGLWLTTDPNSYPYERLVTDDAVFEFPYASESSARHIEGQSAVAEALRKLSVGV